MNCKDALNLRDGYCDGELDLPAALQIESHLQTCAGCASAYHAQRELSGAIRRDARYFGATELLQSRIRAALPVARADSTSQSVPWRWLNMGASLALAVIATWSLTLMLGPLGQPERLAQEVVASHVRSLMASHLTDVSSSDQHTVKPWFNGKLDFSPPVKDLTAQGYPLVGGRLDYVDQRQIAALVYRHRQHLINVFIWPAASAHDSATKAATQLGYQVLNWTQSELNYWMVSDLNLSELQILAQKLQGIGAP